MRGEIWKPSQEVGEERYLLAREVAAYLRVSPGTVRARRDRGLLPVVQIAGSRISLFRFSDVLRYVNEVRASSDPVNVLARGQRLGLEAVEGAQEKRR